MNDKLNDALNEISDKHLMEAETYQKRRFPYWIAAAAAMVALAILLGFAIGSSPAAPTASNPLLDHHLHSSTCSFLTIFNPNIFFSPNASNQRLNLPLITTPQYHALQYPHTYILDVLFLQ